MTATNGLPATGSAPPRKGRRKRNAWIAAISATSDARQHERVESGHARTRRGLTC